VNSIKAKPLFFKWQIRAKGGKEAADAPVTVAKGPECGPRSYRASLRSVCTNEKPEAGC